MMFKKKQRPDCTCEYCYWWLADRKELRDQIICFAFAVLVMVCGLFHWVASSCH